MAVYAVVWLKTKIYFGNLLKDVSRRTVALVRRAKLFVLSKMRRQAPSCDPVEMAQTQREATTLITALLA